MGKGIFIYIFLAVISLSFLNAKTEEDYLKRINYHFVIEDYFSAEKEASEGALAFPASKILMQEYIKALALNQDERAIMFMNQYLAIDPEGVHNRDLLEEISWCVMNKGADSHQYNVRFIALIGGFLANDVKSVALIGKMLKDSNALIRTVALQLCGNYYDLAIREQVARMLNDEKVWMVRLEVINAIGKMKVKEKVGKLKEIAANERSTFEEKGLALQAIVNIYDKADYKEIHELALSPKAGLRRLACEIAQKFAIKDAKEDLIKLADDAIIDVRIAALNAIGLKNYSYFSKKELSQIISKAMEDQDPYVSLTGSWLSLILNDRTGEKILERWVFSSYPDVRRFAAAVLAKTGDRALKLVMRVFKESDDLFVKANAAIGLIGQRKEIGKCCDVIYEILQKEKNLWMIDNSKNALFEVLSPSKLRHVDQIPGYPEAIDQSTRLRLLSILAIMEYKGSCDAIKGYLKSRNWQVSGAAAATLLQEGEEDALQIIKKLLNDDDKQIKVQAALILAFLGREESVIAALEGAYFEVDREMRLQILEALGKIAGPSTHPFFINLLSENSQILRIVDASSLAQSLMR